jgi:ribulose-phosphate 3-epimerase
MKKYLGPWDRKAKLGGALLAPSILSADFARLGEEIASVEKLGADWVHVDVMDNHFVPNLTLGAPIVASLRKVTTLPLDCHLMVENPEKLIPDFLKAGADGITIHVESTPNVSACLKSIRDGGARNGITLRPRTALEHIMPYLDQVDLVLVMTVEPGFGGQSFMRDQVAKIKTLRAEIDRRGLKVLIQVDGGVNAKTRSEVEGSDCIVAGSAVFGEADRAAALKALA